jgi:aminoglycoside phosphotransferase (APT) family kinase protein
MDETTDIRAGEELPLDRLETYLRDHFQISDQPISVRQFPAGSSNLTYLLTLEGEEYVLRRPPLGNTVKSAHDMHREFEVLSKLSTVYNAAPRPLHFCQDPSIIGSEFYLMERKRGIVIRGRIPIEQYLKVIEVAESKFESDPAFQTDICRGFIRALAELHSITPESASLGDLGKPEGYNRRQVEGWTDRYFAAKTHKLTELEEVIVWLNENTPAESAASIIHNDFKFDNVMLDPRNLTNVIAVLDWEMVTVGDPLMDLGTSLGYWMSREAGEDMLSLPFNPRQLMESVTRQQLVDLYSEESGRKLPDMLFYYVFGTFKIAVIAQQIYSRFVKGFTKDPRFARFDRFASALGSVASESLERGRI